MDRLRHRADFLAAAKAAKAPASTFVLQARDRHDTGPVRIGLTVSKKVGNAVERNRVRRRLREVVRLTWKDVSGDGLKAGHDYVLVGRRAALSAEFSSIIDDYQRAIARLHHARRSRHDAPKV